MIEEITIDRQEIRRPLENIQTVISIIGHKPNRLFGYYGKKDLYEKLRDLIEVRLSEITEAVEGNILLVNGLALGTDRIFSKISFELAKQDDRYFTEALIPYAKYEANWPQESQEEYYDLLKQFDVVTYMTKKDYLPSLALKRDKYMINESDFLLAVYTGGKGEILDAIKYAKKVDVPIIRIRPREIYKKSYF